MANLPEADEFTEGVYQWEVTDPNEAGPDGVMTRPLKALTNRTRWLKNQIAGYTASIADLYSKVTDLTSRIVSLEALQPKNVTFLRKSTYVIGNIAGVSSQTRTVSFPSVGTSSYMVVGTLVSKSANFDVDNNVFFMVRQKTATSFVLCLREIDDLNQNLDFDYMLIPL